MNPSHESNEAHHLYGEIVDMALKLPVTAITKLTLLAIIHTDVKLRAQPMSSTQIWTMLGGRVSKRSVERSLRQLETSGVIHRTHSDATNNVKITQLNFKAMRALTQAPSR